MPPAKPLRDINCVTCSRCVYRTDGVRVLHNAESRRPSIVLRVSNKLEVIFCSRSCAARWIMSAPEASLRRGYPLC